MEDHEIQVGLQFSDDEMIAEHFLAHKQNKFQKGIIKKYEKLEK